MPFTLQTLINVRVAFNLKPKICWEWWTFLRLPPPLYPRLFPSLTRTLLTGGNKLMAWHLPEIQRLFFSSIAQSGSLPIISTSPIKPVCCLEDHVYYGSIFRGQSYMNKNGKWKCSYNICWLIFFSTQVIQRGCVLFMDRLLIRPHWQVWMTACSPLSPLMYSQSRSLDWVSNTILWI